MKRIPWKKIALACFAIVILILMRSAVTIGKSIYYGFDWYYDLLRDPWFYVGFAATGVGLVSLGVYCIASRCSRIKD